MSSDSTKLTIEMPKNEHQKLKTLAAALCLSINDLVISCLRDNVLYCENKPNSATNEVFQDTDKGKNLYTVDSVEDLFDDLGI